MSADFEFDEESWGHISDEAKDLLIRIFKPEKDRILPKKILTHPWLKKFAESEEIECSAFQHQFEGIHKFQKLAKIRQIMLSYLANRASDEDIAKEKELFEQMDKNKDGYITKKEFSKVNDCFKLGYDVNAIFESMDLDQNGAINYNEFIAASLNDKVTKDPKRIKN